MLAGSHHTKEAIDKNRKAHIGMLLGINHPMYGKHHNQETKDKISNTLIGNIPWNKGRKVQSNTGRTHFKLNSIPWNNGISPSDETKRKISDKLKGNIPWIKGKYHSKETKKNNV